MEIIFVEDIYGRKVNVDKSTVYPIRKIKKDKSPIQK